MNKIRTLILNNKYFSKFNNNFLFLVFFSYIFLWDLEIGFKTQLVILLLPIYIFFLYEIKDYVKNLIITISFYFILVLHSLMTSSYTLIDLLLSKKIIFISILFFCIFHFRKFLLENFFHKKSINFFYVLIFISLFSNWISEGLIRGFENFQIPDPCHWKKSIMHEKFIFLEISHLSMMLPTLLIFTMHKVSIEKSLIRSILYIPFLIFLYSNISTTGIVGTTISIIAIYMLYDQINFKFVVMCLITLVLIFFNLNGKNCKIRLADTFTTLQTFNELQDEKNKSLNEKKESLNEKNKPLNEKNKSLNEKNMSLSDKKNESLLSEKQNNSNEFHQLWSTRFKYLNQGLEKKETQEKLEAIDLKLKTLNIERFEILSKKTSLNLSSQVFIRSMFISFETLKNKFFGFGIFNYNEAFELYRFDVPFVNYVTLGLNSHDASNNFAKFSTEFGYLSIILYLLLFCAFFSKKIDISTKIFFYPIIITQLVRGAGYLNGGFALAVLVIILTFLKKNK